MSALGGKIEHSSTRTNMLKALLILTLKHMCGYTVFTYYNLN